MAFMLKKQKRIDAQRSVPVPLLTLENFTCKGIRGKGVPEARSEQSRHLKQAFGQMQNQGLGHKVIFDPLFLKSRLFLRTEIDNQPSNFTDGMM
jgi:hypothetical protein